MIAARQAISREQNWVTLLNSGVTHVFLKPTDASDTTVPTGQIRARLFGGGSVSFQLASWEDGQVNGTSRNFGSVSLNQDSIHQVEFNLDRLASDAEEESEEEDGE